MKTLLLTALALTLSATAWAAPHRTPYYWQKTTMFENLPIGSNDIVMLGDSITDGGEWAEFFPGLNMKNRGISGDNFSGVSDRLQPILDGKPRKLFLMIGINDLSQGKKPHHIAEGNRAIIRKIKQASPDTQIYLQSLLPVNDHYRRFLSVTSKPLVVAQINTLLKKVAEEEEVTYVDLFSKFAVDGKLNPKLSNDGLHLTGPGYELWRSIIEPLLK